jgi:ethanolamine permease
MSTTPPSPAGPQALQKTLGPLMIWGLGVGYVISGSYFGWNYGLAEGGPWGMLLATALATVLYVSFVLGYAELACALPRAGGAFVYATRAFGPKRGFLVGYAQLVEYTLAPPAIAFGIGSYVNQSVPELPVGVTAVGAYLLFSAIHMWGVKLSVTFELVVTILAVIVLVVFGAVALPAFSWETFGKDPIPEALQNAAAVGWGLPPLLVGAFMALPFALWFYLAIEGVANVAEEAKDPQRDLPKGFLTAMGTLVLLATTALLGAVGAGGWRKVLYLDGVGGETTDSPLPLAIKALLGEGHALFAVLTVVGLLGLIASFHGILLAASRALLEFGRAGYAPAAVGRLHAERGTPIAALVLNLGIGLIALALGRTDEVILLAIFGALTVYLFSTVALMVLRKKEPSLFRPYRAPGYPVVPLVSLVLTVLALAAMVVSRPDLALFYAGLLAVGYVVWLIAIPKARRVGG